MSDARPDIGTTRIGRGGSEEGTRHSPYGRPILKAPTWTWEVPCYFYAGGLAGASAGLAYLSALRGEQELARRAWAIALAGTAASPPLLISDLGRPARFLNMLRMFKVTSPMSVGTWILSAFGAATAVAALDALAPGRVPVLRRVAPGAAPAAALLGLPLASYTAALIADTAVPAWHEARRTLPGVFVAGAAASAGGAAAAVVAPAHAVAARRLAIGGAVAEIALEAVMERRLGDLGTVYRSGAARRSALASRLLLGGGATALGVRGVHSRAVACAAGAAINAGALCARWSVYEAGFASAARPDDTVLPQRARIRAGRARGAARRGARPGEGGAAAPAASTAGTGTNDG